MTEQKQLPQIPVISDYADFLRAFPQLTQDETKLPAASSSSSAAASATVDPSSTPSGRLGVHLGIGDVKMEQEVVNPPLDQLWTKMLSEMPLSKFVESAHFPLNAEQIAQKLATRSASLPILTAQFENRLLAQAGTFPLPHRADGATRTYPGNVLSTHAPASVTCRRLCLTSCMHRVYQRGQVSRTTQN